MQLNRIQTKLGELVARMNAEEKRRADKTIAVKTVPFADCVRYVQRKRECIKLLQTKGLYQAAEIVRDTM
jgi:hypothetical protein